MLSYVLFHPSANTVKTHVSIVVDVVVMSSSLCCCCRRRCHVVVIVSLLCRHRSCHVVVVVSLLCRRHSCRCCRVVHIIDVVVMSSSLCRCYPRHRRCSHCRVVVVVVVVMLSSLCRCCVVVIVMSSLLCCCCPRHRLPHFFFILTLSLNASTLYLSHTSLWCHQNLIVICHVSSTLTHFLAVRVLLLPIVCHCISQNLLLRSTHLSYLSQLSIISKLSPHRPVPSSLYQT